MRRTQISMTDEQAEALRRLSALRERSQAALLRDALDTLLEADARAARAERARSVVGSFRSGVKTTSEHHDEALDDAYSS
ncbi:MAG TPA: ribbon-helix-helix protein, CopG family [Acidimicrobiia bacterium]|nr:ribbon-helix-helix protein, CopG family [Acidimicrobiia bacterium]